MYRKNLTEYLLAQSNSNQLTLPVKYDNTSLALTLGLSIKQLLEIVNNKIFSIKINS